MKKILSIFIAGFLFAAFAQGQTLDKLFKKYSDNDRFEYMSIGKGMLSFASILADFSSLTEGQMEKITGLKMLKLAKDPDNRELTEKFTKEVVAIIEKGGFETSLEKRDKDKRTSIYKRVDKNANADMLIVSRSNEGINVIWVRGKTSEEEMERVRLEKQQEKVEEVA